VSLSNYGIETDCNDLRAVLKELRQLREEQISLQQGLAENSAQLRAAVTRYNTLIQALQGDVIETLGPQVSVENPLRAVRVREENPT
jgi:hypothetical protein